MIEEDNSKIKEQENYYAEHEKLSPISSDASLDSDLTIDETDADLLSLDDAPTPPVLPGAEREETETGEPEKAAEAADETAKEVFDVLAAPVLPTLPRENRASLQMQSPNRLHFYWSVKNNPYQTLHRLFGKNTGSYQIVVKLVNRRSETEEIFAAEAEGSRWFDVDSNSQYQTEVGFYAPNRPFIRILHSNIVETPRKSPSPRRDLLPAFNVSATQFAEVLDRSGFRQDALEVAFAGDDSEFADEATARTFAQITGKNDFTDSEPNETRYALLALAAGAAFDQLRGGLNPGLANILQAESDKLNAEKIRSSLEENFGAAADEFIVEEETVLSSRVIGASLVNFPRTARRKVEVPSSGFQVSDFNTRF